MPVPLPTLRKMVSTSVSDDVEHVIDKRKRAKAVYWVASRNGKIITKLCDSYEEVSNIIGDTVCHIQKLHPELDRELINKIRNS